MQAFSTTQWPWSSMAATVAFMPKASSAHAGSVENVAERLRLTREALGYSQASMSRISGISQQALNNYEAGRNLISIASSGRLCTAIGVTFDWIYRGEMGGLPHELATKIQKALRDEKPARRA